MAVDQFGILRGTGGVKRRLRAIVLRHPETPQRQEG
jgi:hypothetical protein